MAAKRLQRFLSVIWDRDAARRMQQEADAAFDQMGQRGSAEFQAAMAAGGRKAGTALTRELTREYNLRIARARLQFAEGAIDEKAFEREGREAAQAFNRGLTGGIRSLQASGKLTDLQAVGLAGRFKRVSGGAGGMFGAAGKALGSFAAPLAGAVSIFGAINQANQAIDAADRLDSSIRKLGGTARLTGIDLAFLEANSQRAQSAFRLSIPLANDLTTEVARLASKAGDIDKTSDALASFLDIGAARGLTAEQTLTAVGQALLGIDEGTDKLFGKNPSAIYDEWARAIGRTGESLSDQEKAQALLDATIEGGAKVRGEYLIFLDSAQGKSSQTAQNIETLRAEMGRSIEPIREMGNELKVSLFEALSGIATELGKIAELTQKAHEIGLNLNTELNGVPVKAEEWLRFLNPVTAGSMIGGRLGAREPEIPFAGTLPGVTVGRPASRTLGVGDPIGRPLPPLPTEEEKRAAEARVKAMWDHLNRWAHSQQHANIFDPTFPIKDPKAGMVLTPQQGPGRTGLVDVEALQREVELMEHLGSVAADVADGIAFGFQNAFELMMSDAENTGTFVANVFKGMGAAALAGIADMARGKAAENVARALEYGAIALGFGSLGKFDSAGMAAAAAAEAGLAAVARAALAGGAAAAGHRASGGAGGSGQFPSTRDGAQGLAERSERVGTEVNLFINPWDPKNPGMQRSVANATQYANERYGEGAKITVKPYPGAT